jgi:hypothetical protein
MHDRDRAWGEAADALGLRRFRSTHPRALATEFDLMRRRMTPATGAPSLAKDWLAGTLSGREVIVFHGPGLGHENAPDQTRVVVRIDPPLLLGLSIFPTPALEGSDMFIPPPTLFSAVALNPARAKAMLDAPRLFAALASIAPEWGSPKVPFVTDDFAAVSYAREIPDLGRAVREAAAVADAAILARASLEPDPAEEEQRAAWQRCAGALALSFDPVRVRIEGDLGGAALVAQLRARDAQTWFDVSAAFAGGPLGISFSLGREAEKGFLSRILERDVAVGDPRFDATFELHGAPSARVRELLTERARELLLALDARALEIACNDTHIAAAFPVDADLRAAIESVGDAARALSQRPVPKSPYRA